MKKDVHNYSFPNTVILFWFYTLPMIIILLFLIIFRDKVFSNTPIEEIIINFTCLAIISLLVIPPFAYVFANSLPAVRLNPNGLEIQIYSPFKTKWILLSWSDIEHVEIYSDPISLFLKSKKKLIYVQSKRLPYFYLIVSAFYKNSLHRGFIITPKIQGYDELFSIISMNKLE